MTVKLGNGVVYFENGEWINVAVCCDWPSVMADLVEKVNPKIHKNLCFTIVYGLSQCSVTHDIMTEILGYKKLCTRFNLKMSDVCINRKTCCSTTILHYYRNKKDKFCGHIITGVEIWIFYINLELKQQLNQWCYTSSKKSKKSPSADDFHSQPFGYTTE